MRRQVRDRSTADVLVPRYGLGCKRPAISNEYLPTFNRDNVRLVTQPIERICPQGIVTDDKTLHEVDAIILATGFLTTEQGNAPAFEVVGSDGVELGQFWTTHRRQAYAGVSVPGFPNFFLTAGPYSGGFNWFAMLEANLAHIMACIDGAARARCHPRRGEARRARALHAAHVARAEGTVFKDRSCASANSYYLDRHDDASLPLPHTPWWRAIRGRWGERTATALARPKGAAHDASILAPFYEWTERNPDTLLFAFLDGDGRITESYSYAQFLQRTTDIASHIQRTFPMDPGERVLLAYPPGVEMICAFFACVRLGLIPVPVYPPTSHGFQAARDKTEFIARDCQASCRAHRIAPTTGR